LRHDAEIDPVDSLRNYTARKLKGLVNKHHFDGFFVFDLFHTVLRFCFFSLLCSNTATGKAGLEINCEKKTVRRVDEVFATYHQGCKLLFSL